jgi:hypothetical protein
MFILLEKNYRYKFLVEGNSRLQILNMLENKKIDKAYVCIKKGKMYVDLIPDPSLKEDSSYNFVLGDKGFILIVYSKNSYFSKSLIPQKEMKMDNTIVKFDHNERASLSEVDDDRITCLCFGSDSSYGCPIHTLQKSNRLIDSSDDEYDDIDDMANAYFNE